MAQFVSTFVNSAPGGDDEDWGSDFEGELCSQEIEDNKINEIREANLLRNSTNDGMVLSEDNSQTAENRIVNARKTGAIPKSGFSYLSNTNGNKAPLATGIESRNNIQPQRHAPQPAAQCGNISMNSENSKMLTPTSNNDAAAKKTPRKLKPEAFSFLNKLPQRNVSENSTDVSKERKTLTPTAFSYAENLGFPKSQGNSIMTLNDTSEASVDEIPSVPLENITSNYETITEDSFPEFVLTSTGNIIDKENEKPPLPARPPPVFKYPPETFSSPRPISFESTCNPSTSRHFPQSVPVYPKLNSSISPSDSAISHPPLPSAPAYPKLNSSISPPDSAISHPPLPPAPAYPKLGHSISSPDSGLKYTNMAPQDRILRNKANNRKSLPTIPVCPAVPKRPLPPLPISNTENVSKIKSQNDAISPESSNTMNEEKWPDEVSTIHGTIFNPEENQLPIFEESVGITGFKESVLQEKLILSPQQRLAQILTNQTSVDSTILRSQQKIASAITSRVTGPQSSSISRFQTTEESDFHNSVRPQEIIRTMPERPLENDSEQVIEDESERQPSYLEAKEATIPRRFTDHETLINSMSRPVLPQKAAPIQRSVSCNSLVQSIKDLSFSVWSKSEKKRNSDGLSVSKKNPRSISVTSSSKISTPSAVTLISTDAPSEATILPHGNSDASILDEKCELHDYAWFHDVEAKEGQLRLLSVGKDGTFLIRPSSRPTEDIKNTMCILYNGKVRNLHIRRRDDGRYVLGTKSSNSFLSIAEMIRHHTEIPVEILPHGATPLKPQMYRILLNETPPKLQKLFAVV